jgi:hypothetical protein
MNLKVLAIAATVVSILFTSCASVHSGMITSSTALNQANFSYVKQNAQGMSQAKYFLGIGGMKKSALVQEAKEDLFRSHSPRANQALANYNLDWKYSTKWFGLVGTIKCYVSADVVEFTK